MRESVFTVDGLDLTVREVMTHADVPDLLRWVGARHVVGLDTETTGLNIHAPGFQMRLAQLSSESEVWVFDPSSMVAADALHHALHAATRLVAHNAPFDLLTLDESRIAPLEVLGPKTHDTQLMARILDPRTKQEGGPGHGLKDLAVNNLGFDASDPQRELQVLFRAEKWKRADGWANVPVDHPTYLRYAALDPVLAVRLFQHLGPVMKAMGPATVQLYEFERQVQIVGAVMQRRGIRLDVRYAERLAQELADEEVEGERQSMLLGVANCHSPVQLGQRLTELGAVLTEKTASGQPKVDQAVLKSLAEQGGPAADVAQAVLKVKRARKWRTSYVDACLASQDVNHRVHPSIQTLQARTARMSISNPPLQQLPASDQRIRRMFVATPGYSLISVDYQAIEMRVLAALANEKAMKQAITDGKDFHDTTATAMFGPDFTQSQRKLAKVVGFGKVYGGGAATLSRQAGTSEQVIKEATARFDNVYPGIKRYARQLQEEAEYGKHCVVTPTGRKLPLDRDRLYAATNYVVQSTARDALALSLLRLEEEGLLDFLLLPIHDEVLAEAPLNIAEDIANAIGEVMNVTLMGVPLTTDIEVLGTSWGSG